MHRKSALVKLVTLAENFNSVPLTRNRAARYDNVDHEIYISFCEFNFYCVANHNSLCFDQLDGLSGMRPPLLF